MKKLYFMCVILLVGCNHINNQSHEDNSNTSREISSEISFETSSETSSESEHISLKYNDCFEQIVINANLNMNLEKKDNYVFDKEKNLIYRQITYQISLKKELKSISYDDNYFLFTQTDDGVMMKALSKSFDDEKVVFHFDNGDYIVSFYTSDEDIFSDDYIVCHNNDLTGCYRSLYVIHENNQLDSWPGWYRYADFQSDFRYFWGDELLEDNIKYGSIITIRYYSIEVYALFTGPLQLALPLDNVVDIKKKSDGKIIELTINEQRKLLDSNGTEYSAINNLFFMDSEASFDELAIGSKVYAAVNDSITNNKFCCLYLNNPNTP